MVQFLYAALLDFSLNVCFKSKFYRNSWRVIF
jgi:hypothetical protein